MATNPQYTYIPVATAIPVFASVQSVPVPDKFAGSIAPDTWGILQATNFLTIRQHIKLFPKSCCSCPPCVKQENSYSVYAGLNQDAQNEFMRIDEVSDDWNRCCCAPYHPVKLELRQYIPTPGDHTSSDYSHMRQDFMGSWGSMSAMQKSTALKEMYMAYPPVMTFLRHDGQRCCFKCPCKCLNTFVCMGCCMDGMDIYAGGLKDDPEGEKGRPYNLEDAMSRMIGSIDLRVGDGMAPMGKSTSQPFASIFGPLCFGGCADFCCDFNFPVTSTGSKTPGDLGKVVKLHPRSLAGGVREMFGEFATFSVTFDPSAPLTPEQKSTILAGQMLYDYMLFNGNTEMCSSDSDGIHIYLCYFLCCGGLVPCEIHIQQGGGGN